MPRRSGDRIYKKKSSPSYYGWYHDPSTSRRVTVCTRTRDRQLARTFLAKAERDAYTAHAEGRPAPHGSASGPPDQASARV